MSTIASPRISTSIRSPSSSRTSFESPHPQQAPRPARRNRAALRDYYGIKAPLADASEEALKEDWREEDNSSELDKEGFNAEAYVASVLAREGLEGVLKVEGGLMSEIRGLDGERKALVYDNYSKLIAATDTIRKMRSNMDPLTPTTNTLSPAISHIAETAAALSSSLIDRTPAPPKITADDISPPTQQRQKQTVKWVLAAPTRLRSLVASGDIDSAEEDWAEVKNLLNKWDGVQGVDEVRKRCEAALKGEDK
ncbi:hypothetical protein M501DRAFT_934410 [Patellaria atrata CBS 101060]|uniref:Vacuolar protein sorting-associated protein 51 homolog n=1 Tax=Patellaria atrata CBS 101060 TaxID=1346257 RepID=A0A9P4SBG8_9PEZI|nr:hypothetical protein M501DRAFT_934410 [Patellaria atrata CBS 101060]